MGSVNLYKDMLRASVLPLLNSGVSELAVVALIDTAVSVCNPNDMNSLSPRQILNVFKSIEVCDTACGFGPGHQSTVLCDIRGPHTSHYNTSYRLEWDDNDVGTQTYEYRGKTYRLAFSNEGWY